MLQAVRGNMLLLFPPSHSLPVYSAVLGFLKDYLPSDRKGLAVYPIFLFYCAVTALILATVSQS